MRKLNKNGFTHVASTPIKINSPIILTTRIKRTTKAIAKNKPAKKTAAKKPKIAACLTLSVFKPTMKIAIGITNGESAGYPIIEIEMIPIKEINEIMKKVLLPT